MRTIDVQTHVNGARWGWRRSAVVVGAIVLAAAGFWFWSATTIAGLPDIPELFQVGRDDSVEIPDRANAFTAYRRACDLFWGEESNIAFVVGFVDDSTVVTPSALESLAKNREAMAVWFEGTTRQDAVYIQASVADVSTMLPVTQRLKSFGRLANLKAYQLQKAGDRAGAWEWIKAGMRAGRHSGTNGFCIERIVGTTLYDNATKQAIFWAADPKLDPRLLRKALADVLEIDAMSSPPSQSVRQEYFGTMRGLAGPRLELMISGRSDDAPVTIGERIRTVEARLMHEPERARRVAKLIYANFLAGLALPRDERKRRAVRVGALTLFRVPGAELEPEEIARWFESSRYAKELLVMVTRLPAAVDHDEAVRAAAIVALAAAVYRRERGKEPTAVADLLDGVLKELPPGAEDVGALIGQQGKP